MYTVHSFSKFESTKSRLNKSNPTSDKEPIYDMCERPNVNYSTPTFQFVLNGNQTGSGMFHRILKIGMHCIKNSSVWICFDCCSPVQWPAQVARFSMPQNWSWWQPSHTRHKWPIEFCVLTVKRILNSQKVFFFASLLVALQIWGYYLKEIVQVLVKIKSDVADENDSYIFRMFRMCWIIITGGDIPFRKYKTF